MKDGISRIPGKTIAAVVTASNPRSPLQRIVLVFTDGTQLELRGEGLCCSATVEPGNLSQALQAGRHAGGKVQVYVQECAPPTEPVYGLIRTKH